MSQEALLHQCADYLSRYPGVTPDVLRVKEIYRTAQTWCSNWTTKYFQLSTEIVELEFNRFIRSI